MQKDLIKKRFAKSLKTYEDNAIVQKEMAKKLSLMVEKNEYSAILELGCGTGLLTKEVIKRVRFENYYAVDIVEDCRKYMEEISSEIKFIKNDIEAYSPDFKPNLIISNASLQWLDDLQLFMKKIKNIMANDGDFLFTIFGKENFKEMKNFIKSPLKYYEIDEIKNICSDLKIIDIKEAQNVLEFNSPREVLYHIKNTGVNALSQICWTKSDLKFFENNYPKINGKYPLTYHPIYIKLGR